MTSIVEDDFIKGLGDQLVGLSLLQAKNLSDYLKQVYGIEPAGGGIIMQDAGNNQQQQSNKVEEKTEFDVVLTAFGEAKIAIIKVVRAATGLGLKEAKDLVEAAPKAIKTGLSDADAQKLKSELEAAGGTCEIK